MSRRWRGFPGSFGDVKIQDFPIVGVALRASRRASRARRFMGTTCSFRVLSCSSRHRIAPWGAVSELAKSMSSHRSCRMAPIRCPVAQARSSARANWGCSEGAIFLSAWYRSSVATGRRGFRSWGIETPRRGFSGKSLWPPFIRCRVAQAQAIFRLVNSDQIVPARIFLPLPCFPVRRASE